MRVFQSLPGPRGRSTEGLKLMQQRWTLTHGTIEHHEWPRCRFAFKHVHHGVWWRGNLQWLDDPLERLQELGSDELCRLIVSLGATAEAVWERSSARSADDRLNVVLCRGGAGAEEHGDALKAHVDQVVAQVDQEAA